MSEDNNKLFWFQGNMHNIYKGRDLGDIHYRRLFEDESLMEEDIKFIQSCGDEFEQRGVVDFDEDGVWELNEGF